LLTFAVDFVYAEDIDSQFSNKQQSSSYIIYDNSKPYLSVNVWGHVQKPGQFLIPYSSKVDLISLLSLAGGPLPGAKLNEILLIRETNDIDSTQLVYKIDLNKYLKTGNRGTIPTMESNDTILINQTFWSSLKQNSSFLQILLYLSVTALQIHQMTTN